PDQHAFEQKLAANAPPADAQRPGGADLIGALHDVHGHGVHHGEEHDHSHDQRDEKKDSAEEADNLSVERVELAEVPDLEGQLMLLDQGCEPGSGCWHVRRASELKYDASHFVIAPTVDELLRERQVHDHVVVVELPYALTLHSSDRQAHDVRGAICSCCQELDLRRSWRRA